MLTNMRNTGNHLHNVDVLRKKKGTVIVCHRPSEEDSRNLEDYTPCSECFGYFKRTLLYKHDCPVSFELPRKKGTKQVNKGELLVPASGVEGQSTSFTTFIQSFRRDAVSLVGRTDRLILKLAETEFAKHGHDQDLHSYIRAKVRETSRLLLELREITGKLSATLEEFISPDMMDTIAEATKNICGYQSHTRSFSKASLALKIGINIKKCALMQKASAIEQSDSVKEEKAAQFVQLLEMTWNQKVSHHAHRSLHQHKRNTPCLFPISEDVVKLSVHLQEKTAKLSEVVSSNESCTATFIESWSLLNQVSPLQPLSLSHGHFLIKWVLYSHFHRVMVIIESSASHTVHSLQQEKAGWGVQHETEWLWEKRAYPWWRTDYRCSHSSWKRTLQQTDNDLNPREKRQDCTSVVDNSNEKVTRLAPFY